MISSGEKKALSIIAIVVVLFVAVVGTSVFLLTRNAAHDDQLWQPQVIQISGLRGDGIDTFWAAVTRFQTLQTANGRLAARRQQQAQAWMWERIDAGLKHAFRHHPGVRAALQTTESEVRQGALPPSIAAAPRSQA